MLQFGNGISVIIILVRKNKESKTTFTRSFSHLYGYVPCICFNSSSCDDRSR